MGGGDNKYYFRTLSGLYYFDDDRNVYYADGALLHGASLDLQLGDLIDLGFHIDGVLYWFDEVGLMSQDSSGIPYCVRALRREELDQLDLYQTLGGLQAPQDDFPSLSNLPRVEFNDPTHPNCIKRKREEDAPGQSVSIKISASHNVGGEPEGSGPGQNPQQNPRPRDSEVTPMPTLEKYYFCASGRAYYFDHCRGLYSEDDRLLYDGSSSFQNAISLPNFYIDEVPYWFESDGLSYRDASGRRCRVHAWLSKQNQLDHYFPLAPNQRSTHQINVATIQLSSNFGFCDDPESVSVLKAMLTSDGCRGSLNGKTDIPSQNVTLNPPQRGLQLGTAVQSQSSSTTKSPSDISASNPNQLSEEQPLFADSEPSVIQDIGNISTLHHATTEPGGNDDDRPVKKRKRGEPILCPECGKECRRPVALREHLRTHTGKKRKDSAVHWYQLLL
ncbi:hypothetical protein FRC11_005436 [Ceratobasidium sp. 423]|nr:hypothetical protein FRC11_005436 [Ceratobasidium sp. 423]